MRHTSSLPEGTGMGSAASEHGSVPMHAVGTPRHQKESGFALLLVFLMASVIAITLYMELPRVAFESQRQKEQLLVQRGEQFKRAIQLYFRASKKTRYPADMDDLDRGFNNMRFLRHRYKDPMTGKDEWRLVHIQNGVLQDSVLNKQGGDKKDTGGSTGNITAMGGITDLNNQASTSVLNAANRRRASEGGSTTTLGPDGQPIQTPGLPGVPGMPGQAPTNPDGTPALNPGVPSTGLPGAPVNSQTGGVSAQQGSPYPTTGTSDPSAPANYPQPGMTPVTPQQNNAAQGLINSLLTSPRQGGMQGLNLTQGTVMGGGMVGVASKADGEGIMVYNERTNYGEWEFIYDVTKDRPPMNPLQGSIGTPASQMGTGAGSGFGTGGAPGVTNNTNTNNSNPFGTGTGTDIRSGRP